jgi:hypothetical protein
MVNVLANNVKISNVKIVESSSNTIICRGIKEEFFGINTLDIGNDGILCEHSEDDIVKINIKIDGKEYKDVYFKLIVDANSTPALIINKNQLASVPFKPIVKKEPDPIFATESLPKKSLINEDLKTLDLEFQKKIKEKEKIIKNLNEEIEKISHINNSKIELEKEQIEENIKNTIEEGVGKYKQKLLEDFFETNNQQTRLQENLIKNTIGSLENSFENLQSSLQEDIKNQKQTLSEYVESHKQKLLKDFFEINNQQTKLKSDLIEDTIKSLQESFDEKYLEFVADVRKTNKEEVKNYTEIFLEKLSNSLNEKQIKDLSDLKEIVHETIKNDLFLVTTELQERFDKRVDEKKNELYENLETYKETLHKEITQIFQTQNENLEEKINETKSILVEKYIQDIEESNNELRKELNEQIAIVEGKIHDKQVGEINFDSNALVAEAAKMLIKEDSNSNNQLKKFKDQLMKDLQRAAETYATNANKRMMRYAEMMSGGGSVAKQFANGGTMDGSLNVTGSILSGGKNLLEIFALSGTGGGGTGRDDVNTIVISNSANWILDGGNTKGSDITIGTNDGYTLNFETSGATRMIITDTGNFGFGGTPYARVQYVLEDDTDPPQITAWDNRHVQWGTGGAQAPGLGISYSSNDGTINMAFLEPFVAWRNARMNFGTMSWYSGGLTLGLVQDSSANVGIGISDPTTKLEVDGTITTTSDGNSTQWNEAYNSLGNYLPLSGGTITDNLSVYGSIYINNNLTIGGNLTALGTATFANTIFTTTSALSVVNTGPGPALYVFQASGPYDVASFYDGDGIEVLHVGNAGPGGFGKVGVNESFPNQELTVKGSISATSTIYANNYLSGGVNLLDIFTGGGGGITEKRFDYTTVLGIDYSYSGTAIQDTPETSFTWNLVRLTYNNNGTISNQASALNSWTGRLTAAYI